VEALRKLFVGGLSWQTTEDGLQRYFQGLGLGVERALIMREKISGRSRGFGFVILQQQDMLDKALSLPLQLDGRKIEAKRAISKRDIEKSHKIFVGGIPVSMSQPDFKKFFENFGALSDCQIMMERDSGRSRGFGFVTFELESAMEKVLATQHSIQGKPVEVKRAEPKKKSEVSQVPIIVPVPAYFPQGYSGYPVAYNHNNNYGQPAFAYDGSGYIAMYPPQYDTQYYDQYYPSNTNTTTGSSTGLSPGVTPVVTPVASPVIAGENSSGSRRGSRREKASPNSPNSPNSPSSPSPSLVDRVRVIEVRRKRGLSSPAQPDPRVRKGSVPAAPNSGNISRKSIVNLSPNWRSRGGSTGNSTATATTTTTTTASTSQKGGTLHKYFQ